MTPAPALTPAPAPAPPPSWPDAEPVSVRATHDTVGGLPRRIRQASLVPQLREEAEDRTAQEAPATERDDVQREAEHVRDRMASLQRGWQRGRRRERRRDDRHGRLRPRTTTGRGRSMTAPHAAAHDSERRGSGELNWLLDELVDRVSSIRQALVLSRDGLATGTSRDLSREDSEHLAAVASGFHSLAKGVGRHFDAGQVRQTVVELDEAFLFVTAAA